MKYFPAYKDDFAFAVGLILEQGVYCLPGSVSMCISQGHYGIGPKPFLQNEHTVILVIQKLMYGFKIYLQMII